MGLAGELRYWSPGSYMYESFCRKLCSRLGSLRAIALSSWRMLRLVVPSNLLAGGGPVLEIRTLLGP